MWGSLVYRGRLPTTFTLSGCNNNAPSWPAQGYGTFPFALLNPSSFFLDFKNCRQELPLLKKLLSLSHLVRSSNGTAPHKAIFLPGCALHLLQVAKSHIGTRKYVKWSWASLIAFFPVNLPDSCAKTSASQLQDAQDVNAQRKVGAEIKISFGSEWITDAC